MLKNRVFNLMTTFCLMLMSCGSSLNQQAESKYIGTVVPPFPESLKTLSAEVLSEEQGFPLTMALVQEKETGNHFLLLGTKQPGAEKPRTYSIVQEIPLGILEKGETIMSGIFYQCGIAGQYDEALVLFGNAIAPKEQPYITEFKQGWRINYETKLLEEISLGETDYRCENVAHTL